MRCIEAPGVCRYTSDRASPQSPEPFVLRLSRRLSVAQERPTGDTTSQRVHQCSSNHQAPSCFCLSLPYPYPSGGPSVLSHSDAENCVCLPGPVPSVTLSLHAFSLPVNQSYCKGVWSGYLSTVSSQGILLSVQHRA